MLFTLGQRWISDTESELGLGIVVALDARIVKLLFPAIDEHRLYTRNEAPLTRVTFNIGDTINSQEGWSLKVESINSQESLLTYIGIRLDIQQPDTSLPEPYLEHKLRFNKPQERLFTGQIDRINQFALRYRAHKHLSTQYYHPWSGLNGIRAAIIPHQIHIANQVSKRLMPRVLLADEVGLGKTIEAGMIIYQQLLAGLVERVLIVVPESLQHQWILEMLRRFNLHFSLFDAERYQAALIDNANPFETEQLIICSLAFIKNNQQYQPNLYNSTWDLLVVDEAHHLTWSEQYCSDNYQIIESLASAIPSILLLTATPEQLGLTSHFARLRLLDPNRFYNYEKFKQEQQNYQTVAQIIDLLLQRKKLTKEHISQLRLFLATNEFDDAITLLSKSATDHNTSDEAYREIINALVDRHGTSRVLFRNTRQSIQGFPQRKLQMISLSLPVQYQTTMKIAGILVDPNNKLQHAEKMLYPEQIYQELETNKTTWWNFDPRVKWLLDHLLDHRHDKILIICAHAKTAIQLAQILREKEAIRVALFHEDLSLFDRDKAAAYFAAKEQGAQVLLCSEIGSEGRNFQFAHQLIMFDLPLNPDLLEQRIGRLDRIGQQHDIQILIPYLENTAQELLFQWYHIGLNAFTATCSTGRTLYELLQPQLIEFLCKPHEKVHFDAFLQTTLQKNRQLKQQLEQGRDKLLELHSAGDQSTLALINNLNKRDGDIELINFTLNLFDIIGINQEDRSDNLIAISPSDHMLVPHFPGISEDGALITFDRQQALDREDAQFISWEHPIIRNGLDLILTNKMGNCSVALLKNKALPAGTQLLELIYIVNSQAPKKLQLSRFLPPTPIRLLIDNQGNNLANHVEFEHLNRQLSPIKRHQASQLAQMAQENIRRLLQLAEQSVSVQIENLKKQAIEKASKILDDELIRLTNLSKVNLNIRMDEINALAKQREQVVVELTQVTGFLDALRFIIVAH